MRISTLLLLACVAGVAAGQGSVAPYSQNFDALATPAILVPGIGTALGPTWDYARTSSACRAQILDVGGLPLPLSVPQADDGNAPHVLILDRAPAGGAETNTLVLHVAGLASDTTGMGFRIRMLLRDLDDEADAEDVIAITDGITPGPAVLRSGQPALTPGYGGHKELLLLDWNVAPLTGEWREVQLVVTAQSLAAAGLTLTNDMRLVIRQHDDGSLGTDGLAIDNVQLESVVAASFPHAENLDSVVWNGIGPGTATPPRGWTQDVDDSSGGGSDWLFRDAPPPGDMFGPGSDHTGGGGKFACAGDIVLGGMTSMSSAAVLVDLSATMSTIAFWVHSNSPTLLTQTELHVDLIGIAPSNAQTIFLDIIPPIPHLGPTWAPKVSGNLAGTLASFSSFKVRFRGIPLVTGGMHRVCIDDITFFQLNNGSGKAPQPDGGLCFGDGATTEINGFTIDSGLPGPYFASFAPGTPFDLQIHGLPGVPVVLVAGPLNVASFAVFPELQLDIGTPNPAPPFIPPDLTIIADGFMGESLLGVPMVTDATGTIRVLIPALPPLGGFVIGFQAVLVSPLAPFGIVTSNAVQLTLP